jgi:hypothetical protein
MVGLNRSGQPMLIESPTSQEETRFSARFRAYAFTNRMAVWIGSRSMETLFDVQGTQEWFP